MRLLLHACCGPCALEPLRLLVEEGHDITIAYMNSNIQPAEEYRQRLDTLRVFAADQGLPVVEGAYDPRTWAKAAGAYGSGAQVRPLRCRACYRQRLDEAGQYASANLFDGLATTLTVSPYQYTDAIREELESACASWGLTPVFRNYTSYYSKAVRRSKELGMYRQNYCGCPFSEAEAAQEREAQRAKRAVARAEKSAAKALRRAEEEAARSQRRAERKAYAEKRAAQRAALKAYKRAREEKTA